MRYLSGICGRQSLFPKSLLNLPWHEPKETAQYHGRLVTVWKGQYNGQVVAAKVFKNPGSDTEQTKKVGAPQNSALFNTLITHTLPSDSTKG